MKRKDRLAAVSGVGISSQSRVRARDSDALPAESKMLVQPRKGTCLTTCVQTCKVRQAPIAVVFQNPSFTLQPSNLPVGPNKPSQICGRCNTDLHPPRPANRAFSQNHALAQLEYATKLPRRSTVLFALSLHSSTHP